MLKITLIVPAALYSIHGTSLVSMDILDVWREICKVIRSAAAQMYKTVYTGYHTTYNLYKTDA